MLCSIRASEQYSEKNVRFNDSDVQILVSSFGYSRTHCEECIDILERLSQSAFGHISACIDRFICFLD